MLRELRDLGVNVESFSLPEFLVPVDLPHTPGALFGGADAESGAKFDELARSRTEGFPLSENRLIPAIEYIRAQRARAVLMREFAAAVSKYDVYLAPSSNPRETAQTAASAISSGIRRHIEAANLCGYPAVSVPNGFTKAAMPTSITFLGRLYNEPAILALARAYQNRAQWHTKTPPLP